MKFFLLALLLLVPAYGIGAYPDVSTVRQELNNSPVGWHVRLGDQVVDKSHRVLIATYSYSVHSNILGQTVGLIDLDGKTAVLPKNAIILNCVIDVQTTPTVGSSAPTIRINSVANGDIKAAALSSLYSGRMPCLPAGSASTAIKVPATGTTTVSATIASGTLASGKFSVILTYLQSLGQ